MWLRILHVVRCSPVALTTREICCALNGKRRGYCLNVDGGGGRCVYWFRRPSHEPQRIRLVRPDCRFSPLALYRYLKELVSRGLVKRYEIYLRDELSTWGYDRHVLYYVTEDQLRRRLKSKSLLEFTASPTG